MGAAGGTVGDPQTAGALGAVGEEDRPSADLPDPFVDQGVPGEDRQRSATGGVEAPQRLGEAADEELAGGAVYRRHALDQALGAGRRAVRPPQPAAGDEVEAALVGEQAGGIGGTPMVGPERAEATGTLRRAVAHPRPLCAARHRGGEQGPLADGAVQRAPVAVGTKSGHPALARHGAVGRPHPRVRLRVDLGGEEQAVGDPRPELDGVLRLGQLAGAAAEVVADPETVPGLADDVALDEEGEAVRHRADLRDLGVAIAGTEVGDAVGPGGAAVAHPQLGAEGRLPGAEEHPVAADQEGRPVGPEVEGEGGECDVLSVHQIGQAAGTGGRAVAHEELRVVVALDVGEGEEDAVAENHERVVEDAEAGEQPGSALRRAVGHPQVGGVDGDEGPPTGGGADRRRVAGVGEADGPRGGAVGGPELAPVDAVIGDEQHPPGGGGQVGRTGALLPRGQVDEQLGARRGTVGHPRLAAVLRRRQHEDEAVADRRRRDDDVGALALRHDGEPHGAGEGGVAAPHRRRAVALAHLQQRRVGAREGAEHDQRRGVREVLARRPGAAARCRPRCRRCPTATARNCR